MAKTAREYVFEGMELLPEALAPFVEKRLEANIKGHWKAEIVDRVQGLRATTDGEVNWDQQGLLKAMMFLWNEAFKSVLGHAERSLVSELLEVRNRLSHNETFSYDDAERALDSMRRLLEAVSASDAANKIGRMRDIILRRKFTELQRTEERRAARSELNVEAQAGLKSWRDVIEPHQDVATGQFLQAEFAADLAKVHAGSAPSEYSDPKEFFARTFLTQGLSNLLIGGAKRLSGQGGDPVVELQTNFGGGKTHSMLGLYHMAGTVSSEELVGLDQLLKDKGLSVPDKVHRAVLVGTDRGPQDPARAAKEAGLSIYTTWGDLAWQLGGREGYDMVADADRTGIAPGSGVLQALFDRFSPCLILIDEWVAYLRQIYKVEGLPSGSFDSNLSFVQSLTEAVKASPKALLIASLPASQIEVGGEGGQEALTRLKQTFSRVESTWRPASEKESYEIVRRRLFKEIPGENYPHRDNTIKQFAKLYRENAAEFPNETTQADYQRALETAYPIHPELFRQLYACWGSVEKFQRTRGVLRLMAQVIHDLWMNQDPSVMIMPASVPIASDRVEPELLHYLEENWQAIIAGDIDGGNSLPYQIDQQAPNLNRYSATRRTARAIFMATAPLAGANNAGIDDRYLNLSIVQPGERTSVFSDALRRLAASAKFMHSDQGRHWYSTKPSLNRIAADKASQYEDALIKLEIDEELKQFISSIGDRAAFEAVQVAPSGSSDVPDEKGGVRLVVLGVDHVHASRTSSTTAALQECQDIFLNRGATPRVYRNTLVFVAPDEKLIQLVDEALRTAKAWESIVDQAETLGLTIGDKRRAETRARQAKETIRTRMKEAWCFLVYPHQSTPRTDVEWQASRIAGQDGLLAAASKKLVTEEALFVEIGALRLEKSLQPVWNGQPHLKLADVWEWLNRYVYLPRLRNQSVLRGAVQTAVSSMIEGPFAYAEHFDESSGNYKGLLVSQAGQASIVLDSQSVMVAPDIASKIITQSEQADQQARQDGQTETESRSEDKAAQEEQGSEAVTESLPKRFSGTVFVSTDRPAHHMRQIIEGIVEQLTSIPGTDVTLKLEIDADVPNGLDANKVRTLIENASTLQFDEKDVR